jgi:hypothetical protein
MQPSPMADDCNPDEPSDRVGRLLLFAIVRPSSFLSDRRYRRHSLPRVTPSIKRV